MIDDVYQNTERKMHRAVEVLQALEFLRKDKGILTRSITVHPHAGDAKSDSAKDLISSEYRDI